MTVKRNEGGVALETALFDALRADGTGTLRGHVLDLAAQAWKMSCGPGPAALAFQRLAEALRDAAQPGAPTPDTPGALPTGDPPPEVSPAQTVLARQLAEAGEEISQLSAGRLTVAMTDPAQAWRQLHLGTLWLPERLRRQALELLGGEHADYLIPPLDQAAEPGITMAKACSHPDAAQSLAGWPTALDELAERLRPVIGVTFTMLEQAAGLFTVGGAGGEIIALRADQDRKAPKEAITAALASLASVHRDPYLRVGWLWQLDAALRSVFPLPVPSPYSAWARNYDGCLGVLTEHAREVSPDAQVEIVRGATPYEDPARREYAPSGNVPVKPFNPSELNTVLWPLRTHVRLAGTPDNAGLHRQGRVIYGHDHGAAYPALSTSPH